MPYRTGSKKKYTLRHVSKQHFQRETLIYVLLFSTDTFILTIAVVYIFLLYIPCTTYLQINYFKIAECQDGSRMLH